MDRRKIESAIAAAVALGGLFGLVVDTPGVIAMLGDAVAWSASVVMTATFGYWLLILGGLGSLVWINFGSAIRERIINRHPYTIITQRMFAGAHSRELSFLEPKAPDHRAHFANEAINLRHLFKLSHGQLRHVVFNQCTLIGEGLLLELRHATFEGSITFTTYVPERGHVSFIIKNGYEMPGIHVIDGVTFVDCTFYDVGVVGDDETHRKLMECTRYEGTSGKERRTFRSAS